MHRWIIAATALAFAAPIPGAAAEASAAPPSITVEGRASADVAPDTAQLILGVSLERPTAASAIADVAKAAQVVVDRIRADGIGDMDVATSSVSLSAVPPDETRGKPPRAAGFRGALSLTVKVRPVERVGTLASRLVDRGANTIEGIDYLSSREEDVLDDLRARAVRDAKRKADLYVAALGLHLGRVLEIIPGEAQARRPGMALRMAAEEPAPAPPPDLPTKPGTLAVSATVSVRWEIAQ